jgi:hypothetical protein
LIIGLKIDKARKKNPSLCQHPFIVLFLRATTLPEIREKGSRHAGSYQDIEYLIQHEVLLLPSAENSDIPGESVVAISVTAAGTGMFEFPFLTVPNNILIDRFVLVIEIHNLNVSIMHVAHNGRAPEMSGSDMNPLAFTDCRSTVALHSDLSALPLSWD